MRRMLQLVVGVSMAAAIVSAGAYGVSGAGTITAIAGTGAAGFSGDGGPAISATMWHPGAGGDGRGVETCTSPTSATIVCARSAQAGRSRRSPARATRVSPGTAARRPRQVCTPRRGSRWTGRGMSYIADRNNARVRKVDAAGTIATIAGTGKCCFSGDGGPATSAQLRFPDAVAVDGRGNVYIGDRDNFRVRKVDAAGTITTIAGTGERGFSGDGGPATSARITDPHGVAVDGKGNVYIADYTNNRVRKVSPGGAISTFAGGIPGFAGDGGPATSARLQLPLGVAVDGRGTSTSPTGTRVCARSAPTGRSRRSPVVGRASPGDGGPRPRRHWVSRRAWRWTGRETCTSRKATVCARSR